MRNSWNWFKIASINAVPGGFADPTHAYVQFAHDKLELLPLTEEVAGTYRSVYRDLKATGELIGANDLWIAAHALTLDLPVVSRNGARLHTKKLMANFLPRGLKLIQLI